MTEFKDTFNGIKDRQRVLADIMRRGSPSPGTTLIAYVDAETLSVEAIESLPTPEPVMYLTDEGPAFDDHHVSWLSDTLRDVAERLAPGRYWTGDGWSRMTGELVTVVCREGEASTTEEETQFWYGWRYSNHLTSAFHYEIFSLTPEGWEAPLQKCAATEPALVVTTD